MISLVDLATSGRTDWDLTCKVYGWIRGREGKTGGPGSLGQEITGSFISSEQAMCCRRLISINFKIDLTGDRGLILPTVYDRSLILATG